jgi:tRNA(Ile2)-agmatinylcytidine synthase
VHSHNIEILGNSSCQTSTKIDKTKTSNELLEILSRLDKLVTKQAALEDDTTNPGIVISQEKLPLRMYWSAVHDVVELEDIKKQLNKVGTVFKGFKKGRGIIGASAAIAWASNLHSSIKDGTIDRMNAEQDNTFELIAYRRTAAFGTPRGVDEERVMELDTKFPTTFNNYDFDNKHVAITPNSPCPVLFGIRGDSDSDLREAFSHITETENTEPVNKWLLFQTNQGTDDHLLSRNISDVKSYSSIIINGTVSTRPWTIPGGHVLFELEDDGITKNEYTSKITCAAYEPTKGFRDTVRGLLPGDKIEIYGGVRAEPITINIEKMNIETLVDHKVKTQNPRCRSCGRAMKSIGAGMGYRCRKCHEKVVENEVSYSLIQRNLTSGLYEVPVSARRHLAKPIKRYNKYTGYVNKPPKSL